MKSVTAGGQDSLDAPFTLPPSQHVLDATIVFTDRLAQVSGTIRDEWFDPSFLQRLTPAGTPVVIADGEHKVQDVRAGGG